MRAFGCLVVMSFVAVPAIAGSPLPNGWIRAGSAPQEYEMGSDPSAAHSGKSGSTMSG